jgi:hypothetical protein
MNEHVSSEEMASPGIEWPIKYLSCIESLLRLYWSPNRFAIGPSADWLLENNLIDRNEGDWFFVTDRGKAYVEAIRALPLPVAVTEWRVIR